LLKGIQGSLFPRYTTPTPGSACTCRKSYSIVSPSHLDNIVHRYIRISSRTSFDNTGASYNITRIINSDASLNLTAYEEYSPLFLSCAIFTIYFLYCTLCIPIQDDFRFVLRPVIRLHHINAHACIPVFPETNMDSEQTLDARAA
jgi:hypothetical protein